MHDPLTVAHEIYLLPKKRKNGTCRGPFLTVWHKDPETDGTDDSCGWFLRLRHVDKVVYEKIVKEFEFNFKHNYWFTEDGYPHFSTSGIVLQMYSAAVWQIVKHNRRKKDKFFRSHLFSILLFAENPVDSLHRAINNELRYRTEQHDPSLVDSQKERIRGLASTVYCDVLRKMRPWYKHPRWHFWHWEIQFHPLQRLIRRYWTKCSRCGKRGFKSAAIGNWSGTEVWHQECDVSRVVTNAASA